MGMYRWYIKGTIDGVSKTGVQTRRSFIWIRAQICNFGVQSINLWCVATEIDMMWNVVGCTFACIEEILAAECLEACHVKIDDRTDINEDIMNSWSKGIK